MKDHHKQGDGNGRAQPDDVCQVLETTVASASFRVSVQLWA